VVGGSGSCERGGEAPARCREVQHQLGDVREASPHSPSVCRVF
jgi:hypothetical protein